MRRLCLAVVILTACGAPPATSHASQPASPTLASAPRASATGSPASPLFAALEAKGASTPYQWDTVTIAGLDGFARAKATFTPMPTPYVGCAGAVIPPSAHVAAGKVYFADGAGTVRSLAVNGQLSVEATFPLTSSQQMLSFAVNPDGSRLLGTVFTIPPKPATGDPCTGSSMFAPGNFTLDVYSTQAGGTARLLDHQVLPTGATSPVPNVMALIGWNKVGPLGTYPTQWATQGGGPHPYGVMVWVDPSSGKVSRQVADPQACVVWDVVANGDFVCTKAQAGDISVRRPDGTEIWSFKAPADGLFESPYLSPQEGRVVAGGNDTAVVGRGGDHVTLNGIYPLGWLDDTTVIAGGYSKNFTYTSLTAPAAAIDIGFQGLFIAPIQS
jgi:hypothetical protein